MKKLLLLLFLFGCGDILGGQLRTLIEPGPEYATWYAETEECTGIKGDFERVLWFTFPDRFPCEEFGTCSGFWDDHRIFLQAENANNEGLVKHEIIHDLLAGSPANDANAKHDDPVWDRCDKVLPK